jgi:hypothetical protein
MSDGTIKRPSVQDSGVASYFSGTIALDFFRTMTGKFLGGGIGRGVYVHGTDPSLVVKIETATHSFQNVAEWQVWSDLEYTEQDALKWFAPCHYISPCGIVLIQARTRPMEESAFPEKMPCFFTDLKYSNFGRFNGRIVAHDYGLHRFINLGATARMRIANWRDDKES